MLQNHKGVSSAFHNQILKFISIATCIIFSHADTLIDFKIHAEFHINAKYRPNEHTLPKSRNIVAYESNTCSLMCFIKKMFYVKLRLFSDLDYPYILCESQDSPTLECPSTTIIQIKDAIYGRTVRSVCPRTLNVLQSTSCNVTVTSIIVSNCSYLQTCLPNASNDIYGDPCRGTYKYLNVTYRCIKGIYISQRVVLNLKRRIFLKI